jgi:glycosyltransferase involved in cell wall biosynthesis
LPETYTASDIFVLPSEHEPFGVVVNEAMLCLCPVIVSDRVGAGFDLVRDAETGFVFAMGDVMGLAAVLKRALSDRELLQQMGQASRCRMAHWSPPDNVAAFVQLFTRTTGINAESPVAKHS